jgi:hypothetical protein
MELPTAARPDTRRGALLGGALVGTGLVVAGLSLAYLAIDTPLVSRLVPGSGASTLPSALLVWALAIVAGGSLLVSGADRLAVIVAGIRERTRRPSPLARALGSLPDEVDVIDGIPSRDGLPVPYLAVGPFGVAVIQELGSPDAIRPVGSSWQLLTAHGWTPAEDPLEHAARDADRVRYWLAQGDLDFVARVHAALVTPDPSMPRSAGCAVITVEQIPAWIAALPRQRSLSESRRQRLLALVRAGVVAEPSRRDW